MASESENPAENTRHPSAPTLFQRRALWRAITGVAIAVIAFLSVAGIVILGKVLGFLQPVLVPLSLAGILAYLLDPVVRWVRAKRFFGRDLSRMQAVLVVFFLAAAAMVFMALRIVIPASQQLGSLFDDKGAIIAKAETVFSDFNRGLISIETRFGIGDGKDKDKGDQEDGQPEDETVEPPTAGETVSPFEGPDDAPGADPDPDPDSEADTLESGEPKSQLWKEFLAWLQSEETAKSAMAFVGRAVNGFFGAIGYIVGFFLVPVYLFFFLKDAASIREKWSDYVPLRNSQFKDELVSVLAEINGYLIAFFRGQVLVSMIDGAATGIILAILGVPYALVIGVALAVLGIIPFVGFIITAIPAVLIAAADSGSWQLPLIVALVFILVQQIDGIFIQPKIVGESVGLHPLTVIFSVLFWSLLIGGILGALLAVPMTAAVKVLFRRYIWEQKLRPTVLSDGDPPPVSASA